MPSHVYPGSDYQAIITRYLGPSNTKPSRVKATAKSGSIVISWDHEHDVKQNHHAAAVALMKKVGWNHMKIIGGGGTPDEDGYAWVLARK